MNKREREGHTYTQREYLLGGARDVLEVVQADARGHGDAAADGNANGSKGANRKKIPAKPSQIHPRGTLR